MQLIKELETRKHFLESVIRQLEYSLSRYPAGTLVFHKDGRNRSILRYYLFSNNSKKYLSKKKDQKTIIIFSRKYYENAAISCYRKELNMINELLEIEKKLEKNFDVPDHIRAGIRQIEYTVDEKIKGFENLSHGSSSTREGQYRITTKEGVLVKSKAEQIIADELFSYKVPFKYELGLKCADQSFRSPDFTVMNPVTGKVFYWEHFGMMDRPDYVRDKVDKMNSYSLTGIIPGDNLILTIADDRKLEVRGFTNQVRRIIDTILT